MGGNSFTLHAQTVIKDSLTIVALDSMYYQNTFNLDDIQFEIGQVYRPKSAIVFKYYTNEVEEQAIPLLDSIAKFLKKHPMLQVEVGNHKDERGSDALTRTFTLGRANTIRSKLIELGVSEGQLVAKGYEDYEPIIPMHVIQSLKSNRYQQIAHQKNRRTEFKILDNKLVDSLLLNSTSPQLNFEDNSADSVINVVLDSTRFKVIQKELEGCWKSKNYQFKFESTSGYEYRSIVLSSAPIFNLVLKSEGVYMQWLELTGGGYERKIIKIQKGKLYLEGDDNWSYKRNKGCKKLKSSSS